MKYVGTKLNIAGKAYIMGVFSWELTKKNGFSTEFSYDNLEIYCNLAALLEDMNCINSGISGSFLVFL